VKIHLILRGSGIQEYIEKLTSLDALKLHRII